VCNDGGAVPAHTALGSDDDQETSSKVSVCVVRVVQVIEGKLLVVRALAYDFNSKLSPQRP
jgi:hypothetical protein